MRSGAVQFHVLSFEGPDPYARAGGIASRITGLAGALGECGHETHLWFVGSPEFPSHEQQGENLYLHRWCQWISAHHPLGVYDGEDGKERDFAASLPPVLVSAHLAPLLARGGRAVVLAEEWHTAHGVVHLDALLRRASLRQGVELLWNANNSFGFERVPWVPLRRAATVTTVSRYMRQRMWPLGVDPLVIPNGLEAEAYRVPAPGHVQELRRRLAGRTVLAKIARWDPDKRWLQAIEIVAELRRRGWRPLLVARGGAEAHGADVLQRARALGLRVSERAQRNGDERSLLEALSGAEETDVLVLRSHLGPAPRRLLLGGAHAVLANSGHEPFGLIGLETMAVGGLACTGGTGEEYAISGRNALVLQMETPREFLGLFGRLRDDPRADSEMRRHARRTALDYAWPEIIRRNLLPRLPILSPETVWTVRGRNDGGLGASGGWASVSAS